eukprot:m.1147429 g.1147429  ORF g.1147429 m.1147429 type:complete len:139 (-) comp24471_c0_seq15:1183-1599(-)
MCAKESESVQEIYLDLKGKLRDFRREKNKQARELKEKEMECQRKLDLMIGTEHSQLQFDINSLNAKLGDNETLISQYRLTEALAVVQGVLPIDIQRKQYSLMDLRNTLVVELSGLLEVEVSSLQHMLNVELVQQVNNL